MTTENSAAPASEQWNTTLRTKRNLWGVWGFVVLVTLYGVYELQGKLRQQEVEHWQQQLDISTNATQQDVQSWLQNHQQLLEQVAANVSVQLYMMQINDSASMDAAIAERQYLENLLRATAMKGGFQAETSPDALVNANISPPLQSGVAIVDSKHMVVATTRSMPPLKESVWQTFLSAAPQAESSISNPHRLPNGKYAIAFQVPVFRVQEQAAAPNFIGRVVGIRLMDPAASFFKSKLPHGQVELLLNDAEKFVSLSANGGQLIAKPLLQDVIDRSDVKGFSVAVRNIQDSTLRIAQTLDLHKAMRATTSQSRWIWLVFGLSVSVITIFLWAVTCHAAAMRAATAATEYQALAKKLDVQSRLLSLVTDHTPNAIYIMDEDSRICFANHVAIGRYGISPEDAQGKTIAAIVGPDTATAIVVRNTKSLAENEVQTAVEMRVQDGVRRFVQCVHLPLANIPVELNFVKSGSRGVLLIEEEISALVEEREKRESTLRKIVDCLVDFVDRRDPYAARHSANVSTLARAIAETMHQPEEVQDTAAYAGKLMNIGKMSVPETMLANTGALDEVALKRIRDAMTSSADMLEGIAFQGPVSVTIRQSLERVDGSGPRGLAGEEILLPARIVAVANAFVGMTSQRSYRSPLAIEDALSQLMKGAGQSYDRSIVAALVHYLENCGGRAQWDAKKAS